MADQVNSNDWGASLFDEIVSATKDDKVAIKKGEGAFKMVNGTMEPIINTKGWNIQVKWKNASVSWHLMSIVKSSNSIELAEFTVSNKLSDEPAFKWWINSTLKGRNKLINKFKTTIASKKIKFGVEVPSTIEEALRLDLENGNKLWQETIAKKMANSRVTFQILEADDQPPVGFTTGWLH